MTKHTKIEELEAKHGEKMIEVKIRFWTNDIAEGSGKILPKHAWTSGVVRMERNEAHGISPQSPVPFHTLMDLTTIVERVLIAHKIKLHPSRKLTKYIDVSKHQ